MAAAAAAGAANITSTMSGLISDLGPLYSIPIAIAAFSAVVGVAVALMNLRKG